MSDMNGINAKFTSAGAQLSQASIGAQVTQMAGSVNQNASNAANRISMQGQITTITGMFPVKGAGELLTDVAFPVSFVEIPTLSSGAHLDDNQSVTVGNFPTVSVVVVRYKIDSRQYGDLYTGATLASVTGGAIAHTIWIHWAFNGHALSNPINGNSGLNGLI